MNGELAETKEQERSGGTCLDSQLWHACAGGLVQMPPVNSNVFYFPQGHAEHAQSNVDFGNCLISPLIPCKVSAIKYMADVNTDEVYAKIRLVPFVKRRELWMLEDFSPTEPLQPPCLCRNGGGNELGTGSRDKPHWFAKTLTQSDANNGGGFSVPRYCAETIFPPLDFGNDPPVQVILVMDVHGEIWKFRHIYRGTPRRHLLTTGWSNFVNKKRLVAGDSIVFFKAENGDICLGVRRARRAVRCGRPESPSSGWNLLAGCSGFSTVDVDNLMAGNDGEEMKRKIKPQSVIEAVTLASKWCPFEVVYHPRASIPEFVLPISVVRSAMFIPWCEGMRFKMAFETEDLSRLSWFMGTVSSVQVTDPVNWPHSPWQLLQVTWDEQDLGHQKVKRVNPWSVELVSSMPSIRMPPFYPPSKKLRLTQPADFSFLLPPLTSTLLGSENCVSYFSNNNVPTGIQGTRHSTFGLYPSSDFFNILQLSSSPPPPPLLAITTTNNTVSDCNNLRDGDDEEREGALGDSNGSGATKTPHILLFGKVILQEQQNPGTDSLDGNHGHHQMASYSDGLGSENFHRKFF